MTTAPDLAGQARSLASLGAELGAGRVALITSSQASLAAFLAEATTLGIRVPEILELIPRQVFIIVILKTTRNFIKCLLR